MLANFGLPQNLVPVLKDARLSSSRPGGLLNNEYPCFLLTRSAYVGTKSLSYEARLAPGSKQARYQDWELAALGQGSNTDLFKAGAVGFRSHCLGLLISRLFSISSHDRDAIGRPAYIRQGQQKYVESID